MRYAAGMFAVLIPTLCVTAGPPDQPISYTDTVYYDVPDETGRLTGGRVSIPITVEPTPTPGFIGVATIRPEGPATRDVNENRLHVVFVGDGYTAAELPAYADQVEAFADLMFAYEPYTTYRPIFAVHRVDVVSNESGVDHDPQGVFRDTALDMRFWCNDIERLLCVSVSKARSYAAQAPDEDLIVALANSSKYGGAGYPTSDLGTASARHPAAPDVVVHENGHALADLADEYTYGGPVVYEGPEPSAVNVTTFTEQSLVANNHKWYRWVAESFPQFDGLHGTFEGADYSQFGVYRPSNNSMMRSLGRPFNMPSVEAHIRIFYQHVDPLDAHTPTQPPPTGCQALWIDPIDVPMQITWSLDGVPLPGSNDEVFDPCGLYIPGGQYDVSVEVVDPIPWVRDEQIRDTLMTESVSWTIPIDSCPPDLTTTGAAEGDPLFGMPDGQITGADIQYYVNAFVANDLLADVTTTGAGTLSEGLGVPDGAVTGSDIQHYVNFWVAGCP